MGWFHEHEASERALREIAEDICVKAKILERCPLHEDMVYSAGEWDATPAYKLGNWLVTNGDPLVKAIQGDRKRFSDYIHEAWEEPRSTECPYCAKNRNN